MTATRIGRFYKWLPSWPATSWLSDLAKSQNSSPSASLRLPLIQAQTRIQTALPNAANRPCTRSTTGPLASHVDLADFEQLSRVFLINGRRDSPVRSHNAMARTAPFLRRQCLNLSAPGVEVLLSNLTSGGLAGWHGWSQLTTPHSAGSSTRKNAPPMNDVAVISKEASHQICPAGSETLALARPIRVIHL